MYTKHKLLLELLDADGNAVAPDGDNPVRIESEIEVGRPVGVKPGTSLPIPFAINFGPIPLAPGGQYVWQLSIDGYADDDWRMTFSTRPAPPEALAA